MEATTETNLEKSHSSGTTIEYVSPKSVNDENKSKSGKKSLSDWQIIRPVSKHRLYSKIMVAPDIKKCVEFWLDEYEVHHENAIYQLLQLFVDLCSYQDFSVERFLDGNEVEEMVTYLECWPNENLKLYGKYLLKLGSKRFINFQRKFETFILNLIQASAQRKYLYDYFMITYPSSLIKLMCESKKRPIRHTGVFLGLKLITGLVMIIRDLFETMKKANKEYEDAQGDTEILSAVTKKQQMAEHRYRIINRLIEFFYENVFKKNWNLQDSALSLMRSECVLEVGEWVKILPERYLKNNVLAYVLQAVTDFHKNVRLSALQVFMKILDTISYRKYLQSNILKYTSVFCRRILDVDMNNAIYAVDLLSIIDKCHKSLSSNVRDRILVKMYCFHYPLAAACGRYLAHKVKKHSVHNTDIIINLIKFQILSERDFQTGPGRLPLLVEAVIDTLPDIQNVSLYVELLKDKKLNDIEIDILIDILVETLNITMTGKCSIQREKPRKGIIDIQRVDKMLSDVFNELNLFAEICDTPRFKIIISMLHQHEKQKFIDKQKQQITEREHEK